MLQQLIKDNPNVFSEVLKKGIPSSVDFLRPDNPFLLATYNLRVNPEVGFHSIIGTGRALRDGSPADGVVPVTSARHPAAISECYVNATHTELLDCPETSDELAKILAVHVHAFDAS